MGYWNFEKDTDKTCFEHLDKHVPDSMRKEAREELISRGYNEDYVREIEYEKSRNW